MMSKIVKYVLDEYSKLYHPDVFYYEHKWDWKCSMEKEEFLKKHNIGILQEQNLDAKVNNILYQTFGYFPEELLSYYILRFE